MQQIIKPTPLKRKKRAIKTIVDTDGAVILDECQYCGAINVPRHIHRTNMCVDCGKLYQRWHAARRKGIKSELQLVRRIVTERGTKKFQKILEDEGMTIVDDTKQCKQCGRILPLDRFRRYKSRGKGIYNTSPGYNTICKDCESINNRAAVALKSGDKATVNKLREYYRQLQDKGFPPVTAAAKRVISGEMEAVAPRRSLDDLLSEVANAVPAELLEHCRLVRERKYASVDDAYEAHKRLIPQLKEAGMYDDVNEQLEDWFDDE